jgi:adenosylmethionine-8-amino-7-oxononanoate aminotransferase
MRKHNLIANVKQLKGYLMDQLRALSGHAIVGDIRGKGFLLGMEFVQNQKTREPFDFEESGYVANLVAKKAFENGLIIYPGAGTVDGHRGEHILIAPPFIIKKEEIDEMISLLDQSITEAEAEVLGK